MADFFEIDFLDVESKKSGDAITLRYEVNGQRLIHVVDAGFEAVGNKVIEHIVKYYDNKEIDHVVLTHPDGDHAGGLKEVVRRCNIGTLWMLRPWLYADHLLDQFETYNSADRLAQRLRAVYPHIAELEEIAVERGLNIQAPFQGQKIGEFTVLAPSPYRYFNLVVQSERTPEASAPDPMAGALSALLGIGSKIINFAKGAWGYEVFSTEDTSAENEMSVVQFARIAGKCIVLTGDGGRAALTEAADFAPTAGLLLPGIDRFQVPHHGSRRNVSTELLDRLLGPRLPAPPPEGTEPFMAICSSALADKDHPRKSVERALVHRGARFVATEGQDIRTQQGAPDRPGWTAVARRPYPEEYEE